MQTKQQYESALIAWCNDQCKMMREQIKRYEAGDKLYTFIGSRQFDDTSVQWLDIYKKRIADLEALIIHHSKAA
jgi:hypothetical protein